MPYVEAVERAVRQEMEKADKAHDWYHIERVRTMALRIASIEGGDRQLIELVALVHDVGDRKLQGSEEAGEVALLKLLYICFIPKKLTVQIMDIVRRVSFKGAGVPDDMPTLEGKIVQDADRLDALGAIGIARAFTYGGSKGRPMFDPTKIAELHTDAEAYFGDKKTSTLHHFDEKLLHLRDRLHTDAARKIADGRHAFMEAFLTRFHREWEGND